MARSRFLVIAGMIGLAAASRLIPHPPNFTPIAAMALFGGAYFLKRRMAFLVPLAAMFLSDLVIGFHLLMPVVYASFALTVLIGFWLRRRATPARIAGTAFAASVLFYLLTNFAVWALGGWYPRTPEGLVACYLAAIPYFRNTVLGDAFYAALLFGGFALVERKFPVLREVPGDGE